MEKLTQKVVSKAANDLILFHSFLFREYHFHLTMNEKCQGAIDEGALSGDFGWVVLFPFHTHFSQLIQEFS